MMPCMNRAFIREPDDTIDPRCPACGVVGLPVPRHTVTSLARPEAIGGLSDAAYFCATPHCNVVYYDGNGQFVDAAGVRVRVWPKDGGAAVCGCYGVTADLIEEDARAGRKEALRLLATRSAAEPARCEFKSASGRCCVPEVQRIYLKAAGR